MSKNKQYLAEALKEICMSKPLDMVTVTEITKKAGLRLPAGKTVIRNFLGTGMISVMPVLLLSVHPRE